MDDAPIRLGQLIAPFGPGSIYTDRRGVPQLVCGLDHWYERWNAAERGAKCERIEDFVINEHRLSRLLRVPSFRRPPDFRRRSIGRESPPNSELTVGAHRFPRWYRNTKTGLLRRFNLDTRRVDRPGDGARWQPVRFIAVCAAGHLSDFPWKQWADCRCAEPTDLHLTDSGGANLSSISVYCAKCGDESKQKSLARATHAPEKGTEEKSELGRRGIDCTGEMPWLGDITTSCSSPLVGALINQTNIYFPRVLSSIWLPTLDDTTDEVQVLRSQLMEDSTIEAPAKMLWDMGNRDGAIAVAVSSLSKRGIPASAETVATALAGMFGSITVNRVTSTYPAQDESELTAFRRAERDVILQGVKLTPAASRDLRVVTIEPPDKLGKWVSNVCLLERLKETRVFYGFDRLEPPNGMPSSMPEAALRQLFRTPPSTEASWLPAIEVFGEGIYVELREEAITAWQTRNEVWLQERLSDSLIERIADQFLTLAPPRAQQRLWASRYLLTHTLSHVLLNQLVFDSGYGSAALRERLYISADSSAPMAGFLLYTAAGDSEGTLGGLVQLGRPRALASLFDRAVNRAAWCSADPVCSENLGGRGSRLANLAACHACCLLPETSCETINHGLDRAMIVGEPTNRAAGVFAELIISSIDIV